MAEVVMLPDCVSSGPVEWFWSAVDYRTNWSGGEGETESVVCAGVDRLLLYLACLRASSMKHLDLSQTLVYQERHLRGHDAGIMRWMTPGLELSLGDALDQVILSGDGVCSAMVQEVLDDHFGGAVDFVREFCLDQALTGTSLEEGSVSGTPVISRGWTTPRDQVELLEGLCGSAGVGNPSSGRTIGGLSAETARHALSVMRSVLRKSGLPGHLPGYGPHFTDAGHLCCDGGNGDAKASDLGDVMVVFDEGRAAIVAAVFCTRIDDSIQGVKGEAWALDRLGHFGSWLYERGAR